MTKKITLVIFCLCFCIRFVHGQCDISNATNATPQMGAMMSPQFVNLWKMAYADDKYGQYFNEQGTLSIGDDGWPIIGKTHGIRYYPDDIVPQIQKNDVLKFRFKGTKEQLTSAAANAHFENATYRNIQQVGTYVSAEIVISANYPANGEGTNGFKFGFEGHIENVEIVRPGYEFDDPRLITDEYV
ncbi:MAG TPA: hypothetical protein VF691_00955, partial [Cytophagaceae bacterium]